MDEGEVTVEESQRTDVLYATFPRRFFGSCVDAFLWTLLILPGIVFLGSSIFPEASDGLVYLALVLFLLYEPVAVSVTGGTPGHHLMNLRVCGDRSGDELGFSRAFARFILKLVLGIFSFLSLSFSRRNRTLHDALTGSHVRLRDSTRAKPGHFVVDPSGPPLELEAGKAKRVVVGMGYGLLLFLLWVFVPWPFVSAECRLESVCTPGDQVATVGMALVTVGGVFFLLLLSWWGLLPGVRGEGGGEIDGTE
jgi:uncharacterized RDD family membrane protein YckC